MGEGFKLGLLQAGRGIGTSVEELGGSSGMADYFNDKLAYNRHLEPASDYSALSLNPGNIGRTIGGAGASTLTIAPAMAAGTALGGPVGGAALGGAVVFAQSYGDNIQEYRDRLAPMGKSEDEIRMLALGRTLVDSGIEVGLGATPVAGKMLSGFISGVAKKAGGQVTKELTRGALDGLAERTVNHLVQKYGHETLIRASKELLEGTGGEMLEEIGNTANGYLWRAIAGDTQDAPDLHDYAEAAAGGFWGGLPFGGAAALGTARRLGRARREAQSADVETSARNEWEEAAAAQEARENAAAQGSAALQDVAASREAGTIMPEMAGAPAMDAEETVAPDMAQEIVSRQVIHPESVEMPDGSVQVTFPEEAVARAAGGKVPLPGARANALRGRAEGTEAPDAEYASEEIAPTGEPGLPVGEHGQARTDTEAPEIDGLEMADLSDAAERNPIEAAPVSPNGAEAPSDAVKQERQPFTIEAINANLRFRRDRIAAEQLGETLGGVRLEVIDPRKSVSADPAERSGMALLQRLGRVFDTRPVLVRGEGATGFDGNYFDGRLFLDLDARPPLEQATITLNHEITHRLAADNPEAFRNFADSLETLVENPELYRDRLNRYRDAIEQYETQNPDGNYRIDKSPAALREEFVADFLGEEMAKPTFWRKLAERDLTFARKILSILEDVYRKFTGSFKGENRSEADRIFGSNLERAVDIAREYVAESREAETPSRDWTGALKHQPENAAAEATRSFDDWKNGFFRRIDETAHPEDPTVARLKAETEARRDYWDDPGKRGRLAARAEELLETVQRNREAIERKKAAPAAQEVLPPGGKVPLPGGEVPLPGERANAPSGGVRGKESEAKTPGLPREGADGVDNIYLRMPSERVRKDAANGVKLAQEALKEREAPTEPEVKPTEQKPAEPTPISAETQKAANQAFEELANGKKIVVKDDSGVHEYEITRWPGEDEVYSVIAAGDKKRRNKFAGRGTVTRLIGILGNKFAVLDKEAESAPRAEPYLTVKYDVPFPYKLNGFYTIEQEIERYQNEIDELKAKGKEAPSGHYKQLKLLKGISEQAKSSYNNAVMQYWSDNDRRAYNEFLERQKQKEIDAAMSESNSKPDKSEPAAKSAPKNRSGAIEDFGEKIEGARKDYAQKLSDASRNDPAAVPLSQAFPEPDYDRLAESGIPVRAVAAIHALRDSIGAKPRSGWRLAQYTKQLQSIREIARQIVNRELDSEQLDKMLANPLFKRIRESAELYEKLGHSKSLKDYRLAAGSYTMFHGEKLKSPKLIWTAEKAVGGHYREVAYGDTREEAVENLREYLDRETGEDRSRIKFGIFQYRPGAGAEKAGKAFIGKKVGSNTIELKRFDTAAEAREYLGSHQQELEELLKLKQYVPATRSDVNRGRIGQDYRGGKDVTPEMFQEKFGFRGVQFGNWVGKTEERQQNLNEAYDALHDLAGLLNVSTQALSLNGELGLAFGARGKGGVDPASAHYEPDHVVINLTRRNGAGSLAHEWFHALDNYFSRKGGVPTGYLSSGKRGDFAGVRPEMVQAFRKVIAELHDKTGIFDRSERLDEVRSKPYWSTDIEVAARAFESYLHDRLETAGGSSDYLVNLVGESAFTTDMLKAIGGKTDLQDVYPYPTQKESAAVKKIFDEFVGTLREKSENGRAVLFSLPEKLLPPGTVRKEKLTRAEVEKLVAEKKNYLAPDDKPVRNVTVSTDRHLKTSEAEAMLKGIAANPMLRITSNMDTGIVGIITSETARKSRSGKAVQASSVPPYVHAAAMANLKTLFRNAALGVIHQNWYLDPADPQSTDVAAMLRLYVGMEYEGAQYGVKITAKSLTNKEHRLYSVEAHDIEIFREAAENKKPLRENGEGEKGYLFSTDPQSHALAENPARGVRQTSSKGDLPRNSIQPNAFSEKIKSQTEKKPLRENGEGEKGRPNYSAGPQSHALAENGKGGEHLPVKGISLTLQFKDFFEKFKPHDEIIGEKYRDNPKAQHGEIKLSVSQKEADEPGMQTGTKAATGPLKLKEGETLHDQVNPVREKGEIRDRHQRKLETEPYKIRSKAELNRDAAQRIADNGGMKGVIDQILAKDVTFESDVAHRVGTLVLNSKEFKRLDAGSQAAIADAWIKAGMEAARALGARRLAALNLDDIESIQAHVNALVAKIARKKPLGDLKKTIKAKLGIDLFDLPPELAKDPRKLDGFLRELVSENASGWDKMYEFWINSILSGIGTHTANTIGNTANAVYELGMKRFAEASLNLLFRKDDAASFGEFPVVAKAIFNSGALADAITRAKLAWDREILTADGKIEACRAAISGRKGRIIRIPGRALRFADEFSKALIAPAEAAAFAYREAKAQKLNEAETRRHIGQALADPGSAARQYGEQRAMELTFQENPGRAVNALIRISEDGGVAGWIVKYALPFKKTPYNILRQGVRKSPLGALNLMYETGKAALGKRKIDNGFIQHAAEQLLAWGAFLSLCGMADDDDETPFLTGSSPDYGSAEQKFKIDKIPPYSIRLGGTYFSYKRIEPLASMLAVMADGVQALREAKKSGDWDRAYDRMLRCVKQVVSEKTFLSSLGELNKLMEEPERNFGRAATNFAASWMPNIVRQTVNSFDDTVRDHKSRSRGMEWWKDQFDITVSSAGIVRAAPKIDYFGREITKEEFLGAAALDAMFRLVLPVNPVNPDKNMDDAERLIWNYNRKMPDKPYYPDVPDYYFRRNGKTFYFTGEDYQQFARESGQMAHKRILGAIRSGRLRVENPGTTDIILIRKFYQDCRKLVRDRMYRQKRYSE
ncbi:LPD5 domain-containing protein [Victivallis vadensis]|uniref:LPD5 domain-containing protein n=1 Tax=Victivallis vadensis TaxID=172901 RepID=UPI00307D1118